MEKICLISDDPALAEELGQALSGTATFERRAEPGPDELVFLDLNTARSGLLKTLSAKHFVVAITTELSAAPVMEASASGAYETLHRPLTEDAVAPLMEELSRLREELQHSVAVSPISQVPTCAIVGHSPTILDICKKLARLSQVEVPVLITGETGTGKELIAESIAQLSSRFGKPFVVVNCAAMPETLLEAELFGFEKGSFTGAVSAKEGMLKIAHEGTVFFDEVGELPLSLQAKLLRFLQTQTFYPVGSTREVQVNVRVISATNRDLSLMVAGGTFREDLYHRLSVTALTMPPLRERKRDILPLIRFFIGKYRHTAPRQIKGITKAFENKLMSHDWPGNIRELENSIRSAIAMSKTEWLTTFDLRETAGARTTQQAGGEEALSSAVTFLVREALDRKEKNIYEKVHREVDRHLLDYVLMRVRENQSEASRILGINRITLRKKLQR